MAIAYVLTGCTPSLVTDMFTDKYPPESADDVQVFLVGEELPDSALTIGRLKVVDNGLAVKGTYERVLGKAIEATAYYGGNGLALTEHRVPDGRSSIHRIWGDILRLPQGVTDTLSDHSMERALARSDYDGYLAYKKQYNLPVELNHWGYRMLASKFQNTSLIHFLQGHATPSQWFDATF
jgi:hypothetical protein